MEVNCVWMNWAIQSWLEHLETWMSRLWVGTCLDELDEGSGPEPSCYVHTAGPLCALLEVERRIKVVGMVGCEKGDKTEEKVIRHTYYRFVQVIELRDRWQLISKAQVI